MCTYIRVIFYYVKGGKKKMYGMWWDEGLATRNWKRVTMASLDQFSWVLEYVGQDNMFKIISQWTPPIQWSI